MVLHCTDKWPAPNDQHTCTTNSLNLLFQLVIVSLLQAVQWMYYYSQFSMVWQTICFICWLYFEHCLLHKTNYWTWSKLLQYFTVNFHCEVVCIHLETCNIADAMDLQHSFEEVEVTWVKLGLKTLLAFIRNAGAMLVIHIHTTTVSRL